MNIVVQPGLLRGRVEIPASKSVAHRAMIAAALADHPTEIVLNAVNDDLTATAACLNALGAACERTEFGYRIVPIAQGKDACGAVENAPQTPNGAIVSVTTSFLCDEHSTSCIDHDPLGCATSTDTFQTPNSAIAPSTTGSDHVEPADIVSVSSCSVSPTLDCSESGSTLRFLLPVAAALGRGARFVGHGRLPERPHDVLLDAMAEHGATTDARRLPLQLHGRLYGGTFALPGNVSSQYITGLLLALPLCAEDSVIRLTTRLESAPYVNLTLRALADFGIRVETLPNGWRIPGRQRYRSPGRVAIEGDWSGAAFWLAANALGSHVECGNLDETSAQGDRAIRPLMNHLGGEIDVSECPDLVPALAVAAAGFPGRTALVGAARLRLKESDRLASVAALLRALGGAVEEGAESLTIHGGAPLTGGTVDGCGDHRIVMAAAVAATAASSPVTILGAQAVAKSYPDFFRDFKALGGNLIVQSDR